MHPHDTTPTKICTKCSQEKPATSEYFRVDPRGYSDGFRQQCKACEKEARRVWYAANREREIAKAAEWNRANNDRVAENARNRRNADPEKHRTQRQIRDSVNLKRLAEYKRQWRSNHPERAYETYRRYYTKHKDSVKAGIRRYQEQNPEKAHAHRYASYVRYRARKLAANGTHTTTDIQAQYKAQHGKCYYCGVQVGDTYHADHVIPLSRGGSNGPENIVIACPPCNQSKGNKLPHEWVQGGRLL